MSTTDELDFLLKATDAPAHRSTEVLKVGDLPPPKPLRRTLERLELLDDQTVLVQKNDRAPQHLFPKLKDRGYEYETTTLNDETVTIIWRP